MKTDSWNDFINNTLTVIAKVVSIVELDDVCSEMYETKRFHKQFVPL